jgi:isoleucyl-tRNA synthetase
VSTDFTSDVSIGDAALGVASESLRKVRNTGRFLLGNLAGFDPARDGALPPAELLDVDRYLLHLLADFEATCRAAYAEYAYARVVAALLHLVHTDLSAFYFEVVKDRVYLEPRSSRARRSALTAMHAALATLTRVVAPITPFLAEDLHAFAQGKDPAAEPVPSVMRERWPAAPPAWRDAAVAARFDTLRSLRRALFRAVEAARARGVVAGPGDAHAVLATADPRLAALLRALPAGGAAAAAHVAGVATLEATTMLARVTLATAAADTTTAAETAAADSVTLHFADGRKAEDVAVTITVTRVEGAHKCPRCWRHSSPAPDTPCPRCMHVLRVDHPDVAVTTTVS